MDFLPLGKGYAFYQFSSFLLYRNLKRLREFEEIEMSRQSFCTAACVFYEHVCPHLPRLPLDMSVLHQPVLPLEVIVLQQAELPLTCLP
jgi:hypothetical protein